MSVRFSNCDQVAEQVDGRAAVKLSVSERSVGYNGLPAGH